MNRQRVKQERDSERQKQQAQQVEWFDGRDLAVYCDRLRLFGKLWAIPGIRRHQTGDTEMRAVFPPEALDQVAGLIRAKRWGGSGPGRVQNLRP